MPDAGNVDAAVKIMQEQTIAGQAIGKARHTDEEEAKKESILFLVFSKSISGNSLSQKRFVSGDAPIKAIVNDIRNFVYYNTSESASN